MNTEKHIIQIKDTSLPTITISKEDIIKSRILVIDCGKIDIPE